MSMSYNTVHNESRGEYWDCPDCKDKRIPMRDSETKLCLGCMQKKGE